jgi:hypothetical protein
MFDYPNTGWAEAGGMEDPYATTASAYRNIFRMPFEGLGPECYIHERNLARGSDVSLGLVTSQRTWGDTDLINPRMVSYCGLRWYKNRVVVHYDMDAKSVLKTDPKNRDGVRQMLTMAYVVSGRLLLGTSFGNLNEEHFHDLTRIFPYHTEPRSARPVDAFTSPYPRIYDFAVDSSWHQLTFYNPEKDECKISVDLSGDTAFGGLGLDAERRYYVYDFWNDRLVGQFEGGARLEQELRPGEARMMSIHQVRDRPQFLSTNRHVMQGYVDLKDVSWNGAELKGKALVAGGDPFKIILANHGYKPVGHSEGSRLRELAGDDDLSELLIERPESGTVEWSVRYSKE